MLKASAIGNVGQEPETRYAVSGALVVTFSVAINDRERQADGTWADKPTEWLRCSVFGKPAEYAQKAIQKGSKVYVDGKLRMDRWQSKDGDPRANLDLMVDTLQVLTGRKEQQPEMQPRITHAPTKNLDELESLPF